MSIIGLLTMVTGLLAGSLIAGNTGSASFGGVILIGPIPLVFGTDRTTLVIAVAGAIILMTVAFAIMYLDAKKRVRVRQET